MNNIPKLAEMKLEDIINYKITSYEHIDSSRVKGEESESSEEYEMKVLINNIEFTLSLSYTLYYSEEGVRVSNCNSEILLQADEYDYLNKKGRRELLENMLLDSMYLNSYEDHSADKKSNALIIYDIFKKLFPEFEKNDNMKYMKKQFEKIREELKTK